MANASITIPFYVSTDGTPLVSAAAEMEFESLSTLDGTDKTSSAPAISEIGDGWYKFSVAYGSTPFDNGDLVGLINADKDRDNNLADIEKYIPVEIRLDFYSLARSVYPMSQDKLTGDMEIKNASDQTILKLQIEDTNDTVQRQPGVAV